MLSTGNGTSITPSFDVTTHTLEWRCQTSTAPMNPAGGSAVSTTYIMPTTVESGSFPLNNQAPGLLASNVLKSPEITFGS